MESKLPRLAEDGLHARAEGYAGVLEPRRELLRGGRSEHLERRRLVRHEGELAPLAVVVCPVGGHERQLVERYRPRRIGRHHEGDAPDIPVLEVLNEAVHALLGPGSPEVSACG